MYDTNSWLSNESVSYSYVQYVFCSFPYGVSNAVKV